MFLTKKHLSRRTMLKGAGITLGLPLLDAMVPAATALANTAANPVKRAGWVYFPHGAIMNNTAHGLAWDRWTPRTAGRDFEFSPILASLAPFRDHVTVVTGLGNVGTGQVHNTTVGTWLTATIPAPSSAPAIHPSVDQVAARHLPSRDVLVPSMQFAAVTPSTGSAGFYGSSYSANLSFPTANSFLRPQANLPLAYRQVFGAVAGGAMQTSMLDPLYASALALHAQLGAPDRVVLEDYLASVREIERRAQLQQQKITAANLGDPLTQPVLAAERLQAMFDLIVLAFRVDASRIFTLLTENEGGGLAYVTGIQFPAGSWHATTHHADMPNYLQPLVEVQTWLTAQFAQFVAKLAMTPDGDGSLLDHSMIVWGSNMGNSHKHDSSPLPTVLVGKGAGSIRGGQHLVYPEDTPLANLWLTMLHRLDVPAASFATSTGVLTEV